MPMWRSEDNFWLSVLAQDWVSLVRLLCDSPISDSHHTVGIAKFVPLVGSREGTRVIRLQSFHFYLLGPKTLILIFPSFCLLFQSILEAQETLHILSTDWQSEYNGTGRVML